MSAARPTKAALVRAIQGVSAAGIVVGLVEIGADGAIRITPKENNVMPKPNGPKPWD
jgi:hypothetical protein